MWHAARVLPALISITPPIRHPGRPAAHRLLRPGLRPGHRRDARGEPGGGPPTRLRPEPGHGRPRHRGHLRHHRRPPLPRHRPVAVLPRPPRRRSCCRPTAAWACTAASRGRSWASPSTAAAIACPSGRRWTWWCPARCSPRPSRAGATSSTRSCTARPRTLPWGITIDCDASGRPVPLRRLPGGDDGLRAAVPVRVDLGCHRRVRRPVALASPPGPAAGR